jgi:SagB-type dehydrogenase family enzyme
MKIRGYFSLLSLLILPATASLGDTPPSMIKLNKPDMSRGLPVMQALAARASAKEWSDRAPDLQDLSDLLWAANGINRPESGKRTAPSALNAQDIDIYVFTTEAVYRYDAAANALVPVAAGDRRKDIVIQHDPAKAVTIAPVELLLVSDGSKFPFGTAQQRREWGLIDAGIVSQNISIFCAATGLATRPRASVDADKAAQILALKEGANVVLEHPVGWTLEPRK